MAKRFSKYVGEKKKRFVLSAGPGGMRCVKAWWSWKGGVRTCVGKYRCRTKDKKYSRMRSKVSSECKTERAKECRFKSLKKYKKWYTQGQKKPYSERRRRVICGETKARKKKAKRLQGARKLRKDEEMSWAPPRKKSNWPDLEEARSMEESGWRLESQREKRRCQKSSSCRMRSEAPKWTLMAKAFR